MISDVKSWMFETYPWISENLSVGYVFALMHLSSDGLHKQILDSMFQSVWHTVLSFSLALSRLLTPYCQKQIGIFFFFYSIQILICFSCLSLLIIVSLLDKEFRGSSLSSETTTTQPSYTVLLLIEVLCYSFVHLIMFWIQLMHCPLTNLPGMI